MRQALGVLARVPAYGWAAMASALAVFAPVLRRGYVLSYDMVVVPRQPITDAMLGLAAMPPRAVPSDLVVALASRVLPADVVQKVLLVAIVVAAGWAAGSLARSLFPAGAAWVAVAGTLGYQWSPMLYERLVLGQWALLVGWACLPWLGVGLHRLASEHSGSSGTSRGGDEAANEPEYRPDARRAGWAGVLGAVVVSALGSPAAGIGIAVLAAVGVMVVGAAAPPSSGVTRWRTTRLGAACLGAAGIVCVATAANAAWWVPAVLVQRVVSLPADPAGVEAFAPRSDTAFGTAVSLLAGGGVWNGEVAPPGRAGIAGIVVVVALVVALFGLVPVWRSGVVGRMVVVAGLCAWMLVVVLDGPARPVLELLVTDAPGGGLLRDTQKLVMPTCLMLAVGLAGSAHRAVLASRHRTPASRVVPVLVVCSLPVLALPALAWGAGGRLEPVQYPPEWAQARAAVEADQRPGAVLVLPWSLYRRYDWNSSRTSLTAATRMFDRRVVVDSSLPVGQVVVQGDDATAAALGPLARRLVSGQPVGGDELAERGIGFVLHERRGASSGVVELDLDGATPVVEASELVLWRVDADPRPLMESVPSTTMVLLGDIATGIAVLTVVATGASSTRRAHGATVR